MPRSGQSQVGLVDRWGPVDVDQKKLCGAGTPSCVPSWGSEGREGTRRSPPPQEGGGKIFLNSDPCFTDSNLSKVPYQRRLPQGQKGVTWLQDELERAQM